MVVCIRHVVLPGVVDGEVLFWLRLYDHHVERGFLLVRLHPAVHWVVNPQMDVIAH